MTKEWNNAQSDTANALSDAASVLWAVRSVIAARMAIGRSFPLGWAQDPVLEILLNLFDADARGDAMSVAHVCNAAMTPESVTRRWMKMLECEKLIEIQADTIRLDPIVELTDEGRTRVVETMRAVIRSQASLLDISSVTLIDDDLASFRFRNL